MNSEKYLTAAQVCARLGGIHAMTLYRWLRREELAFPKPLVINKRRLFKESEIEAWETRQVEAAA